MTGHAILEPSTRHQRLASLVGVLFHQVCKKQGEQLVREQFIQKQVETQASVEEHEAEAGNLWAGLHEQWLLGLGMGERAAFDALTEASERDAFRIIRSFYRHAVTKGESEFAIARDDLAGRIGMTGKGAGQLIKRLADIGIIKRVREYIPHKFAARYEWQFRGLNN